MDTNKIIFCQVFTYPYSNPLWMTFLPLVNYYSWVQKHSTGVTCEYFQLVNNRSWAVYFLCCTSPTHELSSNFLEARSITRIFVNSDVSCTVCILSNHKTNIIIKYMVCNYLYITCSSISTFCTTNVAYIPTYGKA